MKNKPLISAIVSTYASDRFLRGCLDDLLSQTIADQLEIIVVNSGSPENERTIVNEYLDSHDNIVSVHTPFRETVYQAWNRGVLMARGDFLTSANTDDRHRHDALEVMSNTLSNNPDAILTYAGYYVTEEENETFEESTKNHRKSYLRPEYDRRLMLQGECFPGPQPLWRKSAHQQFGLFSESLVSAGDLEFWLRISEKYDFLRIPEILGTYLTHPGSIEHRDESLSKAEAHKILSYYNSARK